MNGGPPDVMHCLVVTYETVAVLHIFAQIGLDTPVVKYYDGPPIETVVDSAGWR